MYQVKLSDVIFEFVQEWKDMKEAGVLLQDDGLKCAFSRDQPEKHYVQHCIRESGALVWKLLHDENASVFVSGSASKMPTAVAKAFCDVIKSGHFCTTDEASNLLRQLQAAKRYCVEAWT
jgi:sulfite reductase alpha subunit-like flavoprotein